MITVKEFIQVYAITVTVTRTDSNQNMSDMGEGARHWKVLCSRTGTDCKMMVRFSQGSAHTEEPTTGDVLDCLASDASSWENAQSFEDWAGDYGYDTDSRKAEKIFKAVEKQTRALKKFLTDDQYETLLWKTERE